MHGGRRGRGKPGTSAAAAAAVQLAPPPRPEPAKSGRTRRASKNWGAEGCDEKFLRERVVGASEKGHRGEIVSVWITVSEKLRKGTNRPLWLEFVVSFLFRFQLSQHLLAH